MHKKIEAAIFLVDAQGLAHPYQCGFASHLGLVLNEPTVGAAKSRLIGELVEVDEKVLLVDEGEVVSAVVTTRQRARLLTRLCKRWPSNIP